MSTDAVTPLCHRMIEDMNARKLCAGTQRGHIHSCKRSAAFLNRSPDTATTEDIRRFQLHLAEAGVSICNRNRIMTGLRFLQPQQLVCSSTRTISSSRLKRGDHRLRHVILVCTCWS
jgi:hypothetical protein